MPRRALNGSGVRAISSVAYTPKRWMRAVTGWTCNGTGTHVKPVRRSNWGARGPACLGGLDSVEIRLAGPAGPSGHLGQLDEPVQGFGGLAESGSGAGESGGSGGLPRRGGDGGAVMPEGQELLQAGGGLQGGVQEHAGAGARGPGPGAARPVSTPVARAARCSIGPGIPLNAAACSASPPAAAICSAATPRSIARAPAAIACVPAAPGSALDSRSRTRAAFSLPRARQCLSWSL